jgi:hypothetical protein
LYHIITVAAALPAPYQSLTTTCAWCRAFEHEMTEDGEPEAAR